MATNCKQNKVDSNVTGAAFAEEECLRLLPGVGGVDAVWYGLPVNSYTDFGGDLTKKARSPISQSRQDQKGAVVDLDASGGFNLDVLSGGNIDRIAQGFFFADAREQATLTPLNGPKIPVTAVVGATRTFTATGLTRFSVGDLVLLTGFTNASNNGLKTVSEVTATTIVFTEPCINEASPPAAASMRRVGWSLPEGDVTLAVVGELPSLVSTVTDLTTLGLAPGYWVFLGGDAAATRFANNVGYARISAIAAKSISFDDTTWVPVNEAGAAKSIRLFAGTHLRNESTLDLIKRRSYNIERTLGIGENGEPQAEYLEGAVANQLTLNVAQADFVTVDMTFIACDDVYRSGDVGDTLKPGAHIPSAKGDPYNTSSDVYRIKLAVLDENKSNPAALFGYASEATVTINNNIAPNKALGVLGAFDTSAGNFQVGGSMTVFFTTVSAVKAIKANADVGYSIISAAKNKGMIFDIPLLGLGGGRLNVEKDQPIMVPLEPAGAENKYGFTLSYTSFHYLPKVAMPV